MLVLWLHLLLAAPTVAPRVTLTVPLTAGVDAATSAGAGTGVARHDPVERGSWRVQGANDVVGWVAPGNFDKARGTLSLRIRPDWTPNDRTWRAILSDDLPMDPKARNAFRLWKYESSIRFDLRSLEDRYLVIPAAALTPGEWHQLTVTWDSTIGTRLYLDGRRRAASDFQFQPVAARWLYLGGPDNLPGLGDYRDLVVLDRLLSDDEVAQLAAGTLAFTPAPKRQVAPPAPRPTAEELPAKPIFTASLTGTLTATSAGRTAIAPRRSAGVRYVPSPFGPAAYFGEGAVLEYPGSCLPHDRGAISVWVRPDWNGATMASDRTFLREAPPDEVGGDARWLWFWGNSRQLRFDLREPTDAYTQARADLWEPGSWHHLVLGWDAAAGRRAVYVDGRPLRGVNDSGNLFDTERPWPPRPHDYFMVGSRNGRDAALAAMADLVIWDRPLRAADVATTYARLAPVSCSAPVSYYAAGTRSLGLVATNLSAEPAGGLRAHLTHGAEARDIVLDGPALKPGEARRFAVSVGAEPGAYLVSVAAAGKLAGPAAFCYVCEPPPPPVATAPTATLVQSTDLTAALGADVLADAGDSQVKDSPAGRYREAAGKLGSRFAVRLRLAHLGTWHKLEWTWPDDRPRTVDVILNRSEYDVATGTLAGDEYPVTGRMRTQSVYFWPRANDDAAIFMTAEANRPAAVATLKVYELSGPPMAVARPQPRFRDAAPRRVGLYYEDPVLAMNLGGQPSFPSYTAVADRLVAYLESIGCNTLYYPAVWYHGPLYPSPSQGSAQLTGRPHPEDFLRYLLHRFEQRGLQLVVTMNVHDLPSLAGAVADEDRVRAGAATPVTVTWNAGLKTAGWHGTASNFNPLDPAVHSALREVVRELAGRYADSRAFGGVCLHLPVHSLCWFGSLDTGYNDLNLKGFEHDTGLALGLDWTDPFRANRAYRALTGRYRDHWIAWRDQRLAAQWAEYAGLLRAARPDLVLAVNPYTSIDKHDFPPDVPPEAVDYVAEMRGYGADPALLAKVPGVTLMNTLSANLYRWERAHAGAQPETRVYRTFNFSPSLYEPYARLGAPYGINLHDKYWEDDIGRRAGLAGLRQWGQPEQGWRVSTPVPPAPYGLENYAAALGNADITTMTKGGFVIGTVGLEDQLRPWAAAFTQLPAVPFADLPSLADPVRARTCRRPDGEWAYAQNRLAVPLQVVLDVAGAGALTDLAGGRSLPVVNGRVTVDLPAYGLVALWAPAGGARVTGGQVAGAEPVAAQLRVRLAALRAKLGGVPAAQQPVALPRLALAERLVADGRLARAGEVLEEPWVARLD